MLLWDYWCTRKMIHDFTSLAFDCLQVNLLNVHSWKWMNSTSTHLIKAICSDLLALHFFASFLDFVFQLLKQVSAGIQYLSQA